MDLYFPLLLSVVLVAEPFVTAYVISNMYSNSPVRKSEGKLTLPITEEKVSTTGDDRSLPEQNKRGVGNPNDFKK